MNKSTRSLKRLSLASLCLFISTLSVQSQTKKDTNQNGYFYADKLAWSSTTKEIILSGNTSVKLKNNSFKGNGTFSILGKTSLLVIDGKEVAPDSQFNTTGKKCSVVTLTREEAMNKYGSEGAFGAVLITLSN